MKYAIGIDIGGTHFRIALVNSTGKILWQNKFRTPKKSKETILEIDANIKEAMSQKSLNFRKDVIGVGVALASPLNPKTGVVSWTERIGYSKSFNLKKELAKKLRKPVFIENDMNAATLGEATFGNLKNVNNGIVITISTGIGSGLIINKELYSGANFFAGEVGHTPLDHNSDLKCNHGHRGDWEATGSALSVEKRYKKETGQKETAKEVVTMAKKGNRVSKKVLKETAKHIGIGLSGPINVFDPEVVIIFGSFFLEIWPMYKAEIKKYMLPRIFNKKVKFVNTKLGDDGGLLGAASLVFRA